MYNNNLYLQIICLSFFCEFSNLMSKYCKIYGRNEVSAAMKKN